MAIAECGRFVCAAGGRSEREQQRAGSADKQNGWGVPAQLWCASPGADRDREAEAERETDRGREAERRVAKRPRTTAAAVASRDNMVGLVEEDCDLEWLSGGAGGEDES